MLYTLQGYIAHILCPVNSTTSASFVAGSESLNVWSRKGHRYGTFRSSKIEEDIEISANLLDPWSWKLPPFDVGTKISVVFGNSKIGDLLVVRSVKEAGSFTPEKLEK